jgi:lipopolysaccharide/colanic/teichoic acid biosynthesis glycosyltransferase
LLTYNPHIKRLLDLTLAIAAFFVLSPVFFVVCVFILVDSKGPPFFIQERIGKGMLPFRLIKFRSMTHINFSDKAEFNPGDSNRVTKVGAFLRKTKIDELPELINVVKGDMSFVGPRPEVRKYVQAYPEDFKVILKIRPGLSDFASIKYRDEENILADQADPEFYYREVILPDKLSLAKYYVDKISFDTDMLVIKDTLKSIIKNALIR